MSCAGGTQECLLSGRRADRQPLLLAGACKL